MTEKYTNKQIEEAQRIVSAARDAEREQDRQHKLKFIGRFFKTRNSYGSDGWWWLFAVPTRVTDCGNLLGLQFEVKTNGDSEEVEVRANSSLITLSSDSSGWKDISQSECDEAWKGLLLTAADLRKAADAVGEAVE